MFCLHYPHNLCGIIGTTLFVPLYVALVHNWDGFYKQAQNSVNKLESQEINLENSVKWQKSVYFF